MSDDADRLIGKVAHGIEALNIFDVFVNAQVQFVWETGAPTSSSWT